MKFLTYSMVSRRLLYDLLIPAAIVFAIVAIGVFYVYRTPGSIAAVEALPASELKVATSQEIYKDVLQTVLVVAGLVIAVAGVGIYRFLSQQVEARVARGTGQELRIAEAIHKIDLGLVYWNFYQRSTYLAKPDRLSYLDEAISVTQVAYEHEIAGLNEKDREVGRLMLQLRNNWAYYIYEKDVAVGPGGVGEDERKRALSFVDYVAKHLERYPDMASEMNDTVDKVRSRFPQGG